MTLFHESKTKGKGKGKAPERHASTSTSTNTTSPYPSTSGTSGGTQSPISAPPTSIQESENVGAEDIPAHLRDEDLPAYNTDGGVEGGEASTSRRRRFNLFPDPSKLYIQSLLPLALTCLMIGMRRLCFVECHWTRIGITRSTGS